MLLSLDVTCIKARFDYRQKTMLLLEAKNLLDALGYILVLPVISLLSFIYAYKLGPKMSIRVMELFFMFGSMFTAFVLILQNGVVHITSWYSVRNESFYVMTLHCMTFYLNPKYSLIIIFITGKPTKLDG